MAKKFPPPATPSEVLEQQANACYKGLVTFLVLAIWTFPASRIAGIVLLLVAFVLMVIGCANTVYSYQVKKLENAEAQAELKKAARA